WGSEYVAVGTQYDGPFDNVPPPPYTEPYGDVFVIRLGAALTASPLAQRNLTPNTPEVQDVGYDVAFTGDGAVHVASVLDCEERGECFRFYAGGEGDAVVHRLNRTTLATESSSGSSLGEVKAYDLFVRLTATSDG